LHGGAAKGSFIEGKGKTVRASREKCCPGREFLKRGEDGWLTLSAKKKIWDLFQILGGVIFAVEGRGDWKCHLK